MSAVTNSNTGVLPSLQRFDAKQTLGWTALGATVVGTAATLAASSARLSGESVTPLIVGGKAAGVTAALLAGGFVIGSMDLPQGQERSMYSGMAVGAATAGVEALVIGGLIAPRSAGNVKLLLGGSLVAAGVGAAIGAGVGRFSAHAKGATS